MTMHIYFVPDGFADKLNASEDVGEFPHQVFVKFTDHQAAMAEIRTELETAKAEIKALEWLKSAKLGKPVCYEVEFNDGKDSVILKNRKYARVLVGDCTVHPLYREPCKE